MRKPASPTRRTRRTPATSVTVRWPGPLNVPASLEQFRRWGDDLLDRWDGRVLVRTVRVDNAVIPFACEVHGTVTEPAATLMVDRAEHAALVTPIIQRMFVTAPAALAALAATDPVIDQLERQYYGVRPVLQLDPLAALVRSISAQQVNLTWAATVRRRLVEAYGQRHGVGDYEVYRLEADRLACASVEALRALQFTTRKAEYIIGLATAIAQGKLDLHAFEALPDADVITRLTALRGLGRWTAEWFLARTLGRPCVSAGDLGVRKAIGAAYLQGRMPSEAEVRTLTAHWGEAAGVAQQLVLHALSYDVRLT